MKILAINGSPRRSGNTAYIIKVLLKELANLNFEVEIYDLAGSNINGCMACYKCFAQKNGKCAITNDPVNLCIEKIKESDALILGSPTYFANVTSEMKAFIDRVGMVSRANNSLFKRKVGVGLVAMRKSGGTQAFNLMNDFFLSNQMIVPGADYANVVCGGQPGSVESDREGLENLKTLAGNVNWLLKAMNMPKSEVRIVEKTKAQVASK
jgi:multimeric flavodoxin WrbA